MSAFLLLLRNDPAAEKSSMMETVFPKFVRWTEELKRTGKLLAVERLSEEGGRTVRKRGDTIAFDGPYTESKEVVAGLYLIEAPSLAAACEEAARCPIFELGGSIEVRETAPFPKP
jgi:hypothetical protein